MRAITTITIGNGVRSTLVLVMLAMLGLMPRPAAAAAITYDFSGTLQHGVNGNNTVTGQFTIDFATGSITAFDFSAPTGHIDPTDWHPILVTYTPATSPAANFVELAFVSHGQYLWLLFQTTLGSFDGSTFYTGLVQSPSGSTNSQLFCLDAPTCNASLASAFASGAAAPAPLDPPPATVPEPTSLALLVGGLSTLIVRQRVTR
jgi:hypothetical protein